MYEEHVNLRTRIENALNSGEIGNASKLVVEYEMLAPKDMELVNYKALLSIYLDDYENALETLEKAIIQYPLNPDINYNIAYVYEQSHDLLNAYKFYARAMYLYECNEELEKSKELGINEKLSLLLPLIIENKEKTSEEMLLLLDKLRDRMESFFGLKIKYFRDSTPCIGKELWLSDDERRFVAFQRSLYQGGLPEFMRSLYYVKGELLDTQKQSLYIVDKSSNADYFIPISTIEHDTYIRITENGKAHDISPNYSNHFDYYRIKPGSIVQSNKMIHFGKPIKIGHDNKRKKLVLNIFIDGLSQTILNGDQLKKVMPYTYDFFKKGIICTNAYSSAEWTYPSLATFVTGLNLLNHMQYHSSIDDEMRRDVRTLAQYFSEAGYYTAKIDGDWRSIPSYGHTRGIDRYIYQNSGFGLKEEQIIGEVIEHLEAFADVDKYVWMCIDDLHNIADGFPSPLGVQRMMELSDWEIDDIGLTSAKQKFSERKISRYIKAAKHIDVFLNILYQYIENNFVDDEIVISLFADHGQGYLISDEGHFLGQGRTNVAFMFRGGLDPCITDELMSSCDYKAIMCKLAGIELKDELTDGNLPRILGGDNEREWAMAESLHPGDPYYATYYTKDKIFYFENGTKTQSDGRVKIKDYKISVEDYNGNLIEDSEFVRKYFGIMMKHIEPLQIYEE